MALALNTLKRVDMPLNKETKPIGLPLCRINCVPHSAILCDVTANQIQILYKSVCISFKVIPLEKGINPTILPPSMGK